VIGLNKTLPRGCQIEITAVAALLIAVAGCAQSNGAAPNRPGTTLSIGLGFGSPVEQNLTAAFQRVVRNQSLEGLVYFERDGRPRPWLAEGWSSSTDGLTLRLKLRPGVTFHDGQSVTPSHVRDILEKSLPEYLGPAFRDIERIRVSDPDAIEFSLRRRSTFLLEGLDVLIEQSGDTPSIGTGPFHVTNRTSDEVEMQANENYHDGKPEIDRIVLKPYTSSRSAWADMLRGRVDMLYEVGIDALDSLESATQVKIFAFQRPYAYLLILNVRKPDLQDKGLRRALNSAIDRDALVAEALNNHGTPADGPIWPSHWAYRPDLPRFSFAPRPVRPASRPLRVTCLFNDASHERIERIGLTIQRQLRAVGVELELQRVSTDQIFGRLQSGDFDAVLADAQLGPTLRPLYQFWHSGGPYNWGGFSRPEVDAAFDQVRSASDDSAYQAAVATVQRAIIDDPPAIFLAWGERLRAVSIRFDVHEEPGRDILSTLGLWRPAAGSQLSSRN